MCRLLGLTSTAKSVAEKSASSTKAASLCVGALRYAYCACLRPRSPAAPYILRATAAKAVLREAGGRAA